MAETCQAWLRRRQLARKGFIGNIWTRMPLLVQQLPGIKYSHSEVHKIIIGHSAPQQLGKVLTVRPLDVDIHAHPHAAHHGLHVVRHLHLLAALGLPGPQLGSHFTSTEFTVQPHLTLPIQPAAHSLLSKLDL